MLLQFLAQTDLSFIMLVSEWICLITLVDKVELVCFLLLLFVFFFFVFFFFFFSDCPASWPVYQVSRTFRNVFNKLFSSFERSLLTRLLRPKP